MSITTCLNISIPAYEHIAIYLEIAMELEKKRTDELEDKG